MKLHARYQIETHKGSNSFQTKEETLQWNPQQTAVIICDMWDVHWCKGATCRVGEMIPTMNAVLEEARKQGALIIHAPSDTMQYYEGTPERKRAQEAPPAAPLARPTENEKRWTRPAEPALPIDDSDGGCTEDPPCPMSSPWKREHPGLTIASTDAVTDSGEEVFNLCRARGITNLIIMGVHTNMCVLGRTFSIRAMVGRGMNMVLMRDLTDTMYNPRKQPFVSHFRGTDLVIQHIETYWCPTIISTDFLGKPAFRFQGDTGK